MRIPPELYHHDFVALARGELDDCVRLRLLALAYLKEAKSAREIGAKLKDGIKVAAALSDWRCSGVDRATGPEGEAAVASGAKTGRWPSASAA
jgi:hypothetical protein